MQSRISASLDIGTAISCKNSTRPKQRSNPTQKPSSLYLSSVQMNLSRRTVTWCAAIGISLVLLYAGLTAAAWVFVRHFRHVEGVAYTDIALPTRWDRYQVIRGNHHIASGLKLLAAGKFAPGFQQLRVGLVRAPRNRDGRMALAGIYAQTGRTDLAQTTLLDGLAYHSNDHDYVATTMEFLSSLAQDRKVLEICAQLIAEDSIAPTIRQQAALHSARASIFLGNYDNAESTLTQNELHTAPQGRLLLTQIEWERGYRELALIMLRSLAAEFPGDESIYGRLANYLDQSGLDDELGRRSLLNQLAHPESVRSYIDRFRALDRVQDPTARDRAIDQAFAHFQDSDAALLALADYAATQGDVSLAQRVAAEFTVKAWPNARAATLMVIEANLVAGNYAQALLLTQDFLGASDIETAYKQIATGLQGIAFYGVGDPIAGYANLSSLMTQANLRVESLLGIANRLLTMQRAGPAREILAHAVKLDAKNQAALTRLIELDLDNRNIPAVAANLPALTSMRRPSPLVLKRAQTMLGSDECLFLNGRSELLALVNNTLVR